MYSTESFRLSFPSQMVIEESLKVNITTAYLRTEEKTIQAVAGHFADKEIPYVEIRTRVITCLAGEGQLGDAYKLGALLTHQENFGGPIDDIASALADCANVHAWHSSRL